MPCQSPDPHMTIVFAILMSYLCNIIIEEKIVAHRDLQIIL